MICVTDANVWIDLHNADLLDAAFKLEVTWVTPDIVLHGEVGSVDSDLLVDLGLEVRSLSGTELNRIMDLNAQHPSPSPTDLSTLVVARKDDGIVVTGDGPLRRACDAEGIDVHGVLWVLDRLVEREVVAPSRAAAGLRSMVEQGSRLPERAVNRRLRQWDGG